MNILICEGNPNVAMDLSWKLQDMGHHVCGTTSTSIKGMEQCALRSPDLVMVGLNLADGRTGLGLVEALAQLQVPAIIVSAGLHAVPRTTSAKAVLSKPINDEGLTRALAAVEEELEPPSPVVAGPKRAVASHVNDAVALHTIEVSKPSRSWFNWLWRQEE
jgi:CheY-like chemotaxis protein